MLLDINTMMKKPFIKILFDQVVSPFNPMEIVFITTFTCVSVCGLKILRINILEYITCTRTNYKFNVY